VAHTTARSLASPLRAHAAPRWSDRCRQGPVAACEVADGFDPSDPGGDRVRLSAVPVGRESERGRL